MILRRIAEHLRTQNWTAVFLEFLIVATGVFLGIQLGNWNEARIEARQERALVMRLIEDARQSRRIIDGAIEETAAQANAARRVHGHLLDGAVSPPQEEAFRTGLLNLGPWESDGFVRATIEQAIADGSIGLIDSARLRNVIAAHLENIEDRNLAIQNVGSLNLTNISKMRDLVDIRMAPDGPEGEFQRLENPTTALLADEPLRRLVGQYAFAYTIMETLHRDSREMNARYLVALEAYSAERGWDD